MKTHGHENGQPPNAGGGEERLLYAMLAAIVLSALVSAAFGEPGRASEALTTGQMLLEMWLRIRPL